MAETDRLKQKFREILESKMDEFHLLGYDSVGIEEIWACVLSKYKGKIPNDHQLVNDIFSLKPMQLMNWLQMKAFQGEIDMEKNTLL